jgi:hypothetical protein
MHAILTQVKIWPPAPEFWGGFKIPYSKPTTFNVSMPVHYKLLYSEFKINLFSIPNRITESFLVFEQLLANLAPKYINDEILVFVLPGIIKLVKPLSDATPKTSS